MAGNSNSFSIFQIDQKVDEDWPLRLVDHKGQKHTLTLKPGEMLLYESSTVPHARQTPLNGTYFDNLFVHYKPEEKTKIQNPNKIEIKTEL